MSCEGDRSSGGGGQEKGQQSEGEEASVERGVKRKPRAIMRQVDRRGGAEARGGDRLGVEWDEGVEATACRGRSRGLFTDRERRARSAGSWPVSTGVRR
jgi:hypothetical protein